jgi:hypothetical protein
MGFAVLEMTAILATPGIFASRRTKPIGRNSSPISPRAPKAACRFMSGRYMGRASTWVVAVIARRWSVLNEMPLNFCNKLLPTPRLRLSGLRACCKKLDLCGIKLPLLAKTRFYLIQRTS